MSPMRIPNLFYDPHPNLLYSVGGEAYAVVGGGSFNVSQQVQLWGFEPNTQGTVGWELQAVGPTVTFPLDNMMVGPSAAFSSGGPFYLGGHRDYNSSDTSDSSVDEIVSYNFANQSWNNESLPQLLPTKFYLNGQGQYIPNFGQQGVNLFFGGYWPSDGQAGGTDADDIGPLNSIVVYDIQSNQFFTQLASNAPTGRICFCSVGVGNDSASSTYEM
jgi:hypothetical protein